MYIEKPRGLVPCNCGATDEVCVRGDDAKDGTLVASRVYAKIYQPPNGPSDPSAGPPAGCSSAVPNAAGEWCIGYIGGAACAAAPGPYPDNVVWVWGKFENPPGNVYYHHEFANFQGRCETDLPVCCPGGSSSSSSSS
jgi:hypothetical protein